MATRGDEANRQKTRRSQEECNWSKNVTGAEPNNQKGPTEGHNLTKQNDASVNTAWPCGFKKKHLVQDLLLKVLHEKFNWNNLVIMSCRGQCDRAVLS